MSRSMGGARVLVVDDEPAILRAVQTNLARHEFQVSTAETGEQALEAIERFHPDVLLLDLGLPDMDGLDVIRQIRTHSSTPIVVLSVRGGERDKVQALDLGADDYLTKPFGVESCWRASAWRCATPLGPRKVQHLYSAQASWKWTWSTAG